jgi:hypothetical protein
LEQKEIKDSLLNNGSTESSKNKPSDIHPEPPRKHIIGLLSGGKSSLLFDLFQQVILAFWGVRFDRLEFR